MIYDARAKPDSIVLRTHNVWSTLAGFVELTTTKFFTCTMQSWARVMPSHDMSSVCLV